MTVVEVARLAGVAQHVVRYYAREGLLTPRRDKENGYRLFSTSDVSRLRFIRRAKSLGFTLADIAEILGDAEHGESPCPRVRAVIERVIEENRRRLEDLTALQKRLERALAQWEKMPDGVPDGHSVCHLIESTE